MANVAAKLSLNVPAITALCKGERGFSLRSGTGVPTPAIGLDGDFYLDTLVYNIYGPKTGGVWGASTELSNVSDSPRWNSSYATVSSLSAVWNSTTSSVFNLSSDWNSVYSTTRAYSGDWSGALTMSQSVSTAIFANSGSWDSTNTSVYNNSGRWESVYTYVNNSSGSTVAGAITVLNSYSANWDSVYTAVYNTSASWNDGNSAYSSFRANSADLVSTRTSVFNTSGLWDSTYTSVYNTSGSWNSVYTSVYNTSADWNNAWTTLNANSASYQDVNTTVWTYSGGWGGSDIAAVYTTLYNTSGNWNNVYNFWNTEWTTYSASVESRIDGAEGAIGDLQRDNSESVLVAINAGVLDLDLSLGKTFSTTVNENISRVDISNPHTGTTTFTLLLEGNGTTYSLAWPARVVWDSGIEPVRTTQNGRTDIFTFLSPNSGQTYYGIFVGSAYPP